ncbi:triose-phosphate isomerase [Lacimicrobium alkaliphilum]|uniref:Triosephosphate isomerase n=1 Tax=Lacimicrobium alkaliphilum TaxID=1526571 RepID=A0A0U3AIY7_9ALTE|nr:triose-phosphate isomerase [Lacimicrobium alkaliphilum]ALS97954.1 triose-phosphate isomerase [Lacimicrobium alkaliphilum]
MANVNNNRRPIVAGNWKMNGNLTLVGTMQERINRARPDNVDIVVCPPAVYINEFDTTAILTGGQDISVFEAGAHTGDISAVMLKELGCQFVIVGHSERRTDHGESNELVAQKTRAALEQQLTPIVCVGEPLEIREAGQVFDYVAEQLDAVTDTIGAERLSELVIAYEPVWAIGTGKSATPEQAQEVHRFIREHLAKADKEAAQGIRILYGGSVNAANARALFAQADVDGGLIGGASLKQDEFLAICQAAN